MNVKGAWKKGVTGKGVVITILDDGIEKIHDDLKDNYVSVSLYALTICIGETPKWVLLETVKTQMKCHILRHFIRVYTVC